MLIGFEDKVRVRKNQLLSDFGTDSGVGEAFDASWDETFAGGLWRMHELNTADNAPTEVAPTSYLTGNFGQSAGPYQYGTQKPHKNLAPTITKEEAQKKIDDAGLSNDLNVATEPHSGAYYDVLIQHKQESLERQAILDSASGFGNRSAQLGAALVAQILDPANLALMLVPELAPAKFASVIKSGTALQKAGARALAGTVGGTVESAMIEPVIYGANRQDQIDYDMVDSLHNIALGGALGGGLHMTGGFIGDLFKKPRIDIQTDATSNNNSTAITDELAKVSDQIKTLEEQIPQNATTEMLSPSDMRKLKVEIKQAQGAVDGFDLNQRVKDIKATHIESGMPARKAKALAVEAAQSEESTLKDKLSSLTQKYNQHRDSNKAFHLQEKIDKLRGEASRLENLDKEKTLEDALSSASDATREHFAKYGATSEDEVVFSAMLDKNEAELSKLRGERNPDDDASFTLSDLERSRDELAQAQASKSAFDSKQTEKALYSQYRKNGLSTAEAKRLSKKEARSQKNQLKENEANLKERVTKHERGVKAAELDKKISDLESENRQVRQLFTDNRISGLIDSASPATREAMLRTALAMEAKGYKSDVSAIAATDSALGDPSQAFDKLIENAKNRELRGSDSAASKQAEESLKVSESDIDGDLNELSKVFDEFETMHGTKEDLSDFDAEIKRSEDDGRALEAATMCRLNNAV